MIRLSQAVGLYVHIPFCPQRCPYCSFTILTGHTALYDRYVEAVCTEILSWQGLAPKGPCQTVFFGGGTPSILEPAQIQRILDTTVATFGIAANAEITIEANPTTAEAQKFTAFHASGVNRLSLWCAVVQRRGSQNARPLATALQMPRRRMPQPARRDSPM